MSRVSRAVLAVALTLVFGLSAAVAGEVPGEPELVRQQVWFHQADTKVGNLGALGYDALPSWDTTEPASVSGGAGAGYVGNIASEIALGDHTAESGPTFEGTFTGDIDTLAVDLYAIWPTSAAFGPEQGIRTQLLIDDEIVHVDGDAFDVVTEPAGDGLHRLRFAYTGIHQLMTDYRMAVGPDVEHTVRINVVPFYVGHDALYVYDSAESPSGMIFNATTEQLDGYTVLEANG